MSRPGPDANDNREARLLFERCAAGEPGAWDEFLSSYLPLLRRLARDACLHAGSPTADGVEDDVGSVLEILLRNGGAKLLAYDPAYRPSTWLALVVFTEVRNRLRREGRIAAREDDAGALLAAASGVPMPSEAMEERERIAALRAALSSLSVREQLILRMTYEQGLSNRDAGRILRLTETATASLLSRARARLRAEMERAPG